jgi:hypothetical protein
LVGSGRPGKSRVEPPDGVDPRNYRINKFHSHFVLYVLKHVPLSEDKAEDVKGIFQRFIDMLANSKELRVLVSDKGEGYSQKLFDDLVSKYNQVHYNDMVDLDELRK